MREYVLVCVVAAVFTYLVTPLVRAVAAGTTDSGPVYAIDQTATAYAIPGASADLLARLGYRTTDVTAVPAAWVEFFHPGPRLDPAAAQTVVSAGS